MAGSRCLTQRLPKSMGTIINLHIAPMSYCGCRKASSQPKAVRYAGYIATDRRQRTHIVGCGFDHDFSGPGMQITDQAVTRFVSGSIQ